MFTVHLSSDIRPEVMSSYVVTSMQASHCTKMEGSASFNASELSEELNCNDVMHASAKGTANPECAKNGRENEHEKNQHEELRMHFYARIDSYPLPFCSRTPRPHPQPTSLSRNIYGSPQATGQCLHQFQIIASVNLKSSANKGFPC